MIVSKASPTRKAPVNLDIRLVLYLDGVRYSTELVDLAFRRLEQTLESIAKSQGNPDGPGLLILTAISDAWAFVDSFHRLRQLVQQLPGLKQKTPELQIFLRQSVVIEDLRNYVQHLRNEIDGFVDNQMPLWGTLAWVRQDSKTGNQENHIIFPGTVFNKVRALGCTFDTHTGQFVERLVLHVGRMRVELANLHANLGQFWRWFEEHVKPTFAGEKHYGSDAHIKTELKPVESVPHAAPR